MTDKLRFIDLENGRPDSKKATPQRGVWLSAEKHKTIMDAQADLPYRHLYREIPSGGTR